MCLFPVLMRRRWSSWRRRPTARICSCTTGDTRLACTRCRRSVLAITDRKKYSPEEQKKKKAFGEKVFYYRAARLIGDVNLHPSAGKEYNWVSLKEIPEYLKDDELVGLLNRVLE